MAGKKHKVQGLRRRWLTGSMGPVLVILLLVGVLISVGLPATTTTVRALPCGQRPRRARTISTPM